MNTTATRTNGIITLTLPDGTTTTRKTAIAATYTHVLVCHYPNTAPNIYFTKSVKSLGKKVTDPRATRIELLEVVDTDQ